MIERICGICGGAWGKNFKFCPSDGSLLVAVDMIMPASRATLVRRSRKTDPALVGGERRRPSATREFAEGQVEGAAEPAIVAARPAWTNPIFTLGKSHTAAAFDDTACHKRPQVDAQRALALEEATALGPRTNPHPRLVPRLEDELV